MNAARRDHLAPVIARREAVQAVAAADPATTLGIPIGTVNAYRPVGGGANWGEDRAAWQRVAVGREPPGGTGQVGARGSRPPPRATGACGSHAPGSPA